MTCFSALRISLCRSLKSFRGWMPGGTGSSPPLPFQKKKYQHQNTELYLHLFSSDLIQQQSKINTINQEYIKQAHLSTPLSEGCRQRPSTSYHDGRDPGTCSSHVSQLRNQPSCCIPTHSLVMWKPELLRSSCLLLNFIDPEKLKGNF